MLTLVIGRCSGISMSAAVPPMRVGVGLIRWQKERKLVRGTRLL